MHRLPRNLKRWVSKWCVGIFGNGATLYKWKQQNHSMCPRCKDEYEDGIHCVICPCPIATALWSKLMDDLLIWMIKSKGQVTMSNIICSSLTAWRNNMPHDYQENGWSTDLMDATNDQLRLGWDRILYGVWSASWETIQQQHFENIGSKKSATV